YSLSRRPPSSPPFPYTTLFRSSESGAAAAETSANAAGPTVAGASRALNLITRAVPSTGEQLPVVGLGGANTFSETAGEEDFETIDRKSTRLNSSHVKISYAVFC